MKKKNILLILALLSSAVMIGSTVEILSSSGKAGYTGSPGEEGACTLCHSGTLNSGTGSVSMITTIPNNIYAPGQTYQISVTVAQSGIGLFGFAVEALLNNDTTNAGTFVITNTTETQIKTANSRKNVVHKSGGGLATNTKTFNFNWTAPAADVGTLTFYTAGLASNNSGGTDGDFVYTTTLVVKSPVTAGIDGFLKNNATNIYFNNANRSIHISLNNTGSSVIKGNLLTINGQKVCELFNETTTGNFEKNLSVSQNLTKGIYFIQVLQENNNITKKIIIE